MFSVLLADSCLFSEIKSASGSAVSVSAGDLHTCAVLSNGILMCWGSNSNGELGIGDTTDVCVPTAVHLDAGSRWNMALLFRPYLQYCTKSSFAHCQWWQYHWCLKQKLSITQQISSEINYACILGARVAHLALGGAHSCAILQNGTVVCWGLNSDGQLGIQSYEQYKSLPTLVYFNEGVLCSK